MDDQTLQGGENMHTRVRASEGFGGAANSPHRDPRSLWPSHLTDLYSVRTLEHLAGSGHSGYEYPSIS